jgi:membrane protein
MDPTPPAASRSAKLLDRLGRGAALGWRLLSNSLAGLGRHRGTQLAAGMAYYALFSVFPAAIVVAAVAGLVLDDPSARDDAVSFLFEEIPVSDQGLADIETAVDGVISNSRTLGLIGLIALLISASALVSAARNSVDLIFGDGIRRGALRGKGLDVLLVVGLGLLFSLSFAVTLLGQLNIALGGGIGDAIESAISASGPLLSLILTAVVFAVLYHVLPTDRPPWRDIWPGVLFASVGYEVLKQGFSIYLDNFANYSAVYGSLGAVIAFMFFVYLASVVFLIGAEMAAIWPGVRAGQYDPEDGGEEKTFGQRVRETAGRLFSRNRVESG